MEQITAYKCSSCKYTHDREVDALQCEFKHARCKYANVLLNNGGTLSTINYWCGFNWKLSKEQESITKESCFIISYWQCCEKPAYQIRRITESGYIYVSGKGGWSGYYGKEMSIDQLPKPYPKEELYEYQNKS